MDRCMLDEWMDGRIDRWMDGWMDGWMGRQTDGLELGWAFLASLLLWYRTIVLPPDSQYVAFDSILFATHAKEPPKRV
jgi:hypothetical protein